MRLVVLTPGSGCYSLLSVATIALWVFQSSTRSLVVQRLLCLCLASRNYFLTCRRYQELECSVCPRKIVGPCRVIHHLVYALLGFLGRVVRNVVLAQMW